MTDKKKSDTKWKAGVSGNPAGRPPNSRNKTTSDKELADILSKRTPAAIAKVLVLMEKSESENVQLKAALAVIAQDKSMRDYMYKKIQDAKADKGKGSGEDKTSEKAPLAPVISIGK
jgi:hypothetical protein